MLFVLLLLVSLAAWLVAINLFVDLAKEKGHFKDGAGTLWFIGLFATPIVVGLYVVALPDKSNSSNTGTGAKLSSASSADDELPSI